MYDCSNRESDFRMTLRRRDTGNSHTSGKQDPYHCHIIKDYTKVIHIANSRTKHVLWRMSQQTYFKIHAKVTLMSQSIPTGYIPPPGQPPGKFFCLIPCPRAKNDGRIPGGGEKFSQTRRNCSLSLQKSLKN